ncbi:MAG: zinc-ribbon domain-containing protein [Clostridia bacterium]|nr:zinc-ribbon domain-containing protein [Clostridia bacterium]
MICPSCGSEVAEGTAFCTSCGSKIVPVSQPVAQSYTAADNSYQSYQQPNYNSNPSAYPAPVPQTPYMPAPILEDTTPITPWGYIGYMILFSIPLVGLIMLFVYGFGSNTNVNLKNFSRAYLILMLIAVIIWVVMIILTAALGIGAAHQLSSSSSYY